MDCYRYQNGTYTTCISWLCVVGDVGGSHISAGICVSTELELLRIGRMPRPAEQSTDTFLEARRHSFDRECGMESIIGAAIAIAGPFDYLSGVGRMRLVSGEGAVPQRGRRFSSRLDRYGGGDRLDRPKGI